MIREITLAGAAFWGLSLSACGAVEATDSSQAAVQPTSQQAPNPPARGDRPPPPASPSGPMSFFITSVGLGNGANLGGLAGADAHCQALASAAGSENRVWRAYLSAQASGDTPAVNARDRIGSGPWLNANQHQIASDVDNLHYDNSPITYKYALSENGDTIDSPANGDATNRHDILTGSTPAGTALPPTEDMTCGNWTSSDAGGALVGHHDRYRRDHFGSSWNSSHKSRGCSQDALKSSGGDGLFYCFAAD